MKDMDTINKIENKRLLIDILNIDEHPGAQRQKGYIKGVWRKINRSVVKVKTGTTTQSTCKVTVQGTARRK